MVIKSNDIPTLYFVIERIKEFKKINKNDLFKVNKNDVPTHLIQITCSSNDLNKRIDTFMERKREQNNVMNIKDFCGSRNEEEGCARTNSVLIKQKNSKTHLKGLNTKIFSVNT